MLWIYERADQTLRIETRFDNTSEEYLLIVRSPDGTEQAERFADSVSFKLRLESLEQQLGAEEWQSRGVRMLRDGWKIG
jgi:hypothetical protein